VIRIQEKQVAFRRFLHFEKSLNNMKTKLKLGRNSS
jgi:hypothetical protein